MSKKILIVLTIILVIVNAYFIAYFSVEERRLARLCSIILYLFLYLIYKGFTVNKTILGVLFIFLVSDVLGLYFENAALSKVIYLARILGYCLLILTAYKKVRIVKSNPLIVVFFSIIVLLNLYMLYILIESATESINDVFEQILIIIYGAIVVLTTIVTSNYNFRYNSIRSTYFFYTVLAIVISDLSWYCAYFLNINILFYADILFYYLGVFCIISYALRTKESDDVLLTEEES